MRHLRAAVLAGVIAMLLASCSAANPGSGATTTPDTQATASAAAASATASASPSTGLGVTTPPAPSTTGQLHVVLRDTLPLTGNAFVGAVGAEAPDGAVFAAFGPASQGSPVIPAGSIIYVVDGQQPAQVAEHSAVPVTALAADDSRLYVGGGDEIIEYARDNGAVSRTWHLARPVRLMAVGAGKLWAVLGRSLIDSGQVVEISPSAGAVTVVGTDAANVTSIAAGPRGLYYVQSGGATIVHVSPSGARHEAPTHQAVNEQLSGPAAIQAISVIGNRLFVIHDAGQGLDSSSQTYDAATLAGPLSNAPGTAGSNHAIDSLAGPIDVGGPEASACASMICVGRFNLGTGAVTDSVTFRQNTRLPLLLGPYPAVVVIPSSGRVYIDRIG